MQTKICKMFGIEAPIVAFSHCRNVVVEVSKAGGLGVLGAGRLTPEELDIELAWIENHIGGRPYGVDALFPVKFDDVGQRKSVKFEDLVPQEHRDFVDSLLKKYDVPHLPDGEEDAIIQDRLKRGRGTPAYSGQLLDVAFKYPGIKLMVSALGTPPQDIIDRAHAAGVKFGALVGKPEHVARHKNAGIDLLIAVGHEAGGHTGEITTMVLTPQVVDAAGPLPVLAGGGIGRGRQIVAALALGAEGVWCGSVWLTTAESDVSPEVRRRLLAARSSDTVRTKSFTGKPARVLRSGWTDAWEAPGAPEPLKRPLQYLLATPAFRRIDRARIEALVSSAVGQIVGQLNDETTVRKVFYEMLSEVGDTVERMNALMD